jgi:diadenosine tetraphosphatase ApaH/serine/threonine PP2A family protein phosphatase
VGYGPQPAESMITILKVCRPGKMIAGNHDNAVVNEPIGFNEAARRAAAWTRSVVQAGLLSMWSSKRKRWKWLQNLPTEFREGGDLFVHASPRNHLEEYVLKEHTLGVSIAGEDPQQLLSENFALFERTCFIGHTHRPGVITEDDGKWHAIEDLDYTWKIDERKTMINIGSVGQPRDGDPRACYVIYDGKEVHWRRISYDIDKVRDQIYANPELIDRLADRLYTGN